MKLESISIAGSSIAKTNDGAERVEKSRNDVQQGQVAAGESLASREEMVKTVKKLNDGGLYSVRFELKDDADPVIQIVDSNTNEVIRQIPQEEVLRLQEKLEDLRGLIFDTRS